MRFQCCHLVDDEVAPKAPLLLGILGLRNRTDPKWKAPANNVKLLDQRDNGPLSCRPYQLPLNPAYVLLNIQTTTVL